MGRFRTHDRERRERAGDFGRDGGRVRAGRTHGEGPPVGGRRREVRQERRRHAESRPIPARIAVAGDSWRRGGVRREGDGGGVRRPGGRGDLLGRCDGGQLRVRGRRNRGLERLPHGRERLCAGSGRASDVGGKRRQRAAGPGFRDGAGRHRRNGFVDEGHEPRRGRLSGARGRPACADYERHELSPQSLRMPVSGPEPREEGRFQPSASVICLRQGGGWHLDDGRRGRRPPCAVRH